MALVSVCSGFAKITGVSKAISTLTGQFCKPNISRLFVLQTAGIVGRNTRGPAVEQPKHFPYREKKYNVWVELFDKTIDKMDENSKIIVVEGPVAAGKSELAKALAEELDMFHIPEATMDTFYVNKYGFDRRELDPQLPESVRSFDDRNFLLTPNHFNAASFQIIKYQLKFMQYADALEHLFNTGQGVVLERCCYSDFVFMETMLKFGYVSKAAKNMHDDLSTVTLRELLKPHLVIYLDVPVPEVKRRIVERNIPYEVNSEVLTTEYLAHMEKLYKQRYLKEIGQHAELLIYDWTNKGDMEVVVEDIERIDFDNYDFHSPKMANWTKKLTSRWEYAEARTKYTKDKASLITLFNIPCTDAPELMIETEDMDKYYEVLKSAPGEKYAYGYNADQGDRGILWKSSSPPGWE